MNILYIDDDAEDREIFREAVHAIDPDIAFKVAQDGLEGLKTLEESTVAPDFIFLDVNMPRMDGRAFLKEIKTSSILGEVPIIMYSTTSAREEIVSFQQMGVEEFVVKPNTFKAVCDTIKRIVYRRSMKK